VNAIFVEVLIKCDKFPVHKHTNAVKCGKYTNDYIYEIIMNVHTPAPKAFTSDLGTRTYMARAKKQIQPCRSSLHGLNRLLLKWVEHTDLTKCTHASKFKPRVHTHMHVHKHTH
jgi:hypothetical protein